jgi:hypothetical protein
MALRGRVKDSLPLQLILTYAAFLILLDLSVALPGNPAWTWRSGALAVLVQALIVWRLWHRSPIAWFFGLLFPVLSVVSIILAAFDAEFSLLIFEFFSIAQAAILCAPPVLSFVWSRGEQTLPSN